VPLNNLEAIVIDLLFDWITGAELAHIQVMYHAGLSHGCGVNRQVGHHAHVVHLADFALLLDQ